MKTRLLILGFLVSVSIFLLLFSIYPGVPSRTSDLFVIGHASNLAIGLGALVVAANLLFLGNYFAKSLLTSQKLEGKIGGEFGQIWRYLPWIFAIAFGMWFFVVAIHHLVRVLLSGE